MSTSRDPEKFMLKLVARVRKARDIAAEADLPYNEDINQRFRQIMSKLQETEFQDLVPKVKHWEKTFSDQVTALERCFDKTIQRTETDVKGALDRMSATMEQITKDAMPIVKNMPRPPISLEAWRAKSELHSERGTDLRLEDHIFKDTPAMHEIWTCFTHLESLQLKMCCVSFSIFPQGSVVKKRPLIYWWIGEGFVDTSAGGNKTAEEVGEEIFKTLLMHGFIQLHYDSLNALVVNKCTMHPWIRRCMVLLAEDAELFNFNSKWPWTPLSYKNPSRRCRRACLVQHESSNDDRGDAKPDDLLTVFNVDENYLNLKSAWLSNLKRVAVLQLGRWQTTPTHHIEVQDETILQGLGAQQNKHLKYLSLRGVLGISQLPSCIFKLISLEILDLRACHSLEILPEDISSLKNLTHFDISECYMLASMPKGIDKLSSLQVFKGLVIGDAKKTRSHSFILAGFKKLKKLRRLSIYLGSEAMVQVGEFHELKDITSLRHLKISWEQGKRAKNKEQSAKQFSFPDGLEKLDLQGIPLAQVPWLSPNKLVKLKKLYIRGGELESLDQEQEDPENKNNDVKWNVEILRLKYLDNFILNEPKLRKEFPKLRYLEKIKSPDADGSIAQQASTFDHFDHDYVWSDGGGYMI